MTFPPDNQIRSVLLANHWHHAQGAGWFKGEYLAACGDVKRKRFFTMHEAYIEQTK